MSAASRVGCCAATASKVGGSCRAVQRWQTAKDCEPFVTSPLMVAICQGGCPWSPTTAVISGLA
jgi:hypothetical protein